MADPLLGLDAWICGFAAALALVCVLTHALFPRVSPTEPKPSLASFFCALHILPHVRGEGDAALTINDIPKSPGGDVSYSAQGFVEELDRHWSPQGQAPLGKAIVAMSLRWWGLSHVLLGMAKLCEFFQPFFVFCLMTYMDSTTSGPLTGYKLMAAEVLQTLLATTAKSFSAMVLTARLADPVSGALLLMVTRKVFRLSSEGLMHTSAAHVQHVTTECNDIRRLLAESPLSGLGINAAGVVYALVQLHGLAGTLPVVVGTVVSCFAFTCASRVQTMGLQGLGTLHAKQIERLDVINQLLSNFKNVRLLDCMHGFLHHLDAAASELNTSGRRLAVFVGIGTHLVKFLNYFWVLNFYMFSVLIRGEKVVFATGYLTFMFTVVLAGNLMALLGGLESWRALHFKAYQIEVLLRLPERDPVAAEGPAEGPLEVSSADFCWPVPPNPENGGSGGVQQVLTGVDFKPEAGELVLVCGSVGAGKSSLLLSILGQTRRLSGTVRLPTGPVAFQPQEPFLLDATIRENVLLGIPDSECDEAALQKALRASQLAVDFGDPKSTLSLLRAHTATGKQGSNLSGGQRARTALARTVYSALKGARLAILDDPVAQVDNEVMEAAWNAAVVQAMRGVTRVVAVNSQLLGRVAHTADRLVLLKEGRIAYSGPPAAAAGSPEVMEALGCEVQFSPERAGADDAEPLALDAGAGAAALSSESDGVAQWKEVAEGAGGDPAMQLADLIRDDPALRRFAQRPASSKLSEEEDALQLSSGGWASLQTALRRLLQSREGLAASHKSFSKTDAMLSLFKRTRAWLVPCAVPVIISSLTSYCTCWTVRQWELGLTHGWGNVGWWLFLAGQYVLFTSCEAMSFIGFSFGMCSLSLTLNKDISETFRTLGMSYFWQEGSDAEIKVRRVCGLDLQVFLNVAKVPMQVCVCLLHMVPVLYSAPQLLPLLLLVAPVLPRIIQIRTWTVRHLQPCEQTLSARQGVLATDIFDGVTILRSLRRESRFDLLSQDAVYAGMQLRHWGGSAAWHSELLTWVVRTSFVACAIVAITRRRQLGGEAWTAQVLYLNATAISNLLAILIGEFLNCAKLLEDYSLLDSFIHNHCREPEGGEDPPKGWPSEGAISFENVAFRYAPHMHAAVQSLNAEIRPGEKVGVVGKTGSGKSTLVSLLFRLGPGRGHTSGRVRVDGIDLAPLKLSELRRAVALVPQEPAWFRCSLRHQVSGECTDAEILAALERCGLDARQITHTSTSLEALSKFLSPSDLSVGQKQLLMAARALVRRPKILILDESTAFLDGESAERLLEVIATQCKDSTVLSIAHRLRFVLASDRILVLSGGRLIAFDTPSKLLEDQDGYFATNWRLEKLESDG